LGGLQRISGHATEEKSLVAPVWYQSSQFTTHNFTLQKKGINRVSLIQSTISCTVSLITYTVLWSVSCNDGVFSSELMTKTMHLSFHLCYKSYVFQRFNFSFLSLITTHIFGLKKPISISCTFPWLSPMLNAHLLPSVALPALNNRPDIQ